MCLVEYSKKTHDEFIEGIYCFGGKKKDHKATNELKILDLKKSP
jgi:hypothetical protein